MSIVSYKVHPNPPTCKLYLYLGMGNIWRVVCMDCSISLFFSLSFLYVLYRSILSIYLLLPLGRERQDNMKQPRLDTSSNQTPILSSNHPLPTPHSTFYLYTPKSLSFFSTPFTGILPFFPFLSFPFLLPVFKSPTYIYTYIQVPSLESKKKIKIQ